MCPCFSSATSLSGVEVRTDGGWTIRWDWAPPVLFKHSVDGSAQEEVPVEYAPYEYSGFGYLTGSIRSLLRTLASPGLPLAVSGADVRACLEVATAMHQSALRNSATLSLPLRDRASDPLYPRPYRWLGGDASPPQADGTTGEATPQSADDVAEREIPGYGERPKL